MLNKILAFSLLALFSINTSYAQKGKINTPKSEKAKLIDELMEKKFDRDFAWRIASLQVKFIKDKLAQNDVDPKFLDEKKYKMKVYNAILRHFRKVYNEEFTIGDVKAFIQAFSSPAAKKFSKFVAEGKLESTNEVVYGIFLKEVADIQAAATKEAMKAGGKGK